MAQTYTRQSSLADGDTITAALFNDEYNQLLNAFAYSSSSSSSTGHRHDGTTAQGGNIHTIGDLDFLNKIVADSTNNRWGVFVEVSSAAVEQIRIQDGAIVPVTDNDIDLGTSSLEFKDAYFDGTVTSDAFAGPLTGDVTGNVSGTAATVTTAAQSNITSLGTLTTLTVDNVIINGTTIGHTSDTDLLTLTSGVLTVAGELDATSLDISGDADIDGTLEADAITIGGVTLAETISDTVGAMVSSNTETNITVTYEDSDNTLDFVIGTLNQDTTGTAATVTTAAQPNITSLGTLTTLTVDNVIVNGTTIGHTSDTDLITLADGNVTIAGELDLTTLDVSGNADIDGTLEADAITIGGVTLAETISDTVGAMVTSNTESGIAVAYQDADNTLDFTVGTLNQDTTGLAGTATALATARTIGGTSFDGTANIAVGLAATATALATARTIHGVSFDGTANIDLSEVISDTVGAMVGSNTESGITVAYQDSDNTLDFTVGTLNQDTTGTAAIATTVTITDNESTNESNAVIFTAGGDVDGGNLGLESDGNLTYNPSSGTLTATAFAGALTGNVTGNASGTAATVTTAAQSNITSLGTLTTLTVDNVIINGSTIGHTGDTDLITVASGIATVAGEVSMTTLDIGGTNVTSTAAELNILDGVTSTAAELNILDGVTSTAAELNILDGVTSTAAELNALDGITAVVGELNALDIGSTAVGTAVASKAVILDSNKDYTGLRNLTITGELDAATLDISGNVDIDGVLETDNLTVGGAQGSDGQVLTSTGSGVGWEDAASGGVTFKQVGTNFANSLMVGDDSTGTLSSASANTGVGIDIFAALTSGTDNTVMGFGSGKAITTGAVNTAMGSGSLDALTASTNPNVAIGGGALGAMTHGDGGNTACGYRTLEALTTGSGNTAVGLTTALAITTATNNTLLGLSAGQAVTTGGDNNCMGNASGVEITTGANNVCLGTSSGTTNNPGGAITTGSNQIAIGNASSANAHIQIDWTVASDKRDKTDVTPLDMGLDFINKLEPVTYKWDKRAKYEEGNTPDGTHKESWTDVGFLAQDVEEIEAEFGHKIDDETNLTTYASEDKDSYGLTYAKFVPMLVKAVQELSAEVEELKIRVGDK